MTEYVHYCLGFLFDTLSLSHGSVVLIEKKKPKFQRGKLNGVGGKVEPGETHFDAMIREFKEETGVHFIEWHRVCMMTFGKTAIVHVFSGKDLECCHAARTTTDEPVYVQPLAHLGRRMPNLDMLISASLVCECAHQAGSKFYLTPFKTHE